jgi:hypothetical protein
MSSHMRQVGLVVGAVAMALGAGWALGRAVHPARPAATAIKPAVGRTGGQITVQPLGSNTVALTSTRFT